MKRDKTEAKIREKEKKKNLKNEREFRVLLRSELGTAGVQNERTLHGNDMERWRVLLIDQGRSTDTWRVKLSVAPCEEYDLVGCDHA